MNTIKIIGGEIEIFIGIVNLDNGNNSCISWQVKFGVVFNSEFIKRAANSLRSSFISKFDPFDSASFPHCWKSSLLTTVVKGANLPIFLLSRTSVAT